MRRLATALVTLGCLAAAAPAAAAPRTETPLPAPGGSYPDVVRSLVHLTSPAPAGAPAACGALDYIRYRRASGPVNSQQADAVIVMLPGMGLGATSLDTNATGVVQAAASAGRSVEYWALERRQNCLEDHTGIQAAAAAGDAGLALDYFYGGATLGGQTFAGFPEVPGGPAYLQDFGLRRALVDVRTVITDGIPNPAVRAAKVFCGGHGIGAVTAGLLMQWDFDGNPFTRRDAGYNLCAGSVALDGSVNLARAPQDFFPGDPVDPLAALVYFAVVQYYLHDPATPSLLPLPGTTGINSPYYEAVALNAALAPASDSQEFFNRLSTQPSTPAGDALRESIIQPFFLGGIPFGSYYGDRLHLSGQALLGAFFDDNSVAYPELHASIGFYNQPGYDRGGFAGAGESHGQTLVLPRCGFIDRVCGWDNYDTPEFVRNQSRDLTSPGSEISDMPTFARQMAISAQLDFFDWYVPFTQAAEHLLALFGSRAGDLGHILYTTAPASKPRLTISTEPSGVKFTSDGPNDVVHVLPGYNHLDLVTAAPLQNGGGFNRAVAETASFVLERAGGGATLRAAPKVVRGAKKRSTVLLRLRAAAERADR